jgi:hypothetical protein
MFSHEASHWKELTLNGNDDYTRVFIKQVSQISVLIIPFLLIYPHLNKLKEDINNTLKKKLQHYKDEIQKLKNESYATSISSIISFLLYAVKQAMVFSCKVFIFTTIWCLFAILLVTVASDKRLVNDIIRGIISFLWSSAQLVLSDDSIISITSSLQSSVKLVFSYAIIISTNISFSLPFMIVMFSYAIISYSIISFPHFSVQWVLWYVLIIAHSFIPKFPGLLFSCAILCGTITLFSRSFKLVVQKLNAVINYASQLKAGSKLEKERQHQTVYQLHANQFTVAQQEQRQFTVDNQQQLNTTQQKLQNDQEKLQDKQDVQEELNIDQQNAKVEKQEFINVHEQFKTDQQNATVDKQELINVQEQLNIDHQNSTVDKQELITVQEQLNIDQQNATVDKQELINVLEEFNIDQQNSTVDKQELINVQEQLNIDQQNATIEKQELINVQQQLNTDHQNVTIDNEASNDEQRQLQIQKLKDEYRQQLQRKGHICAKNCVLCTILWSCQQKLGSYLCGPQLILIMLFHAGHAAELIEREYLKCEKNLEIFMKCKVIDAPVGCEYLWSDEMSKKFEMIEKAWNALMNMDKGVCLMGIKSSKALGGGHCVVFDTRTVDGTVIFHDPQIEEEAKWSKKNFIDCLDDPDIAGIGLFPLNLQKLKEIIDEYSEILHHTGKSNQTLAVMPLRV